MKKISIIIICVLVVAISAVVFFSTRCNDHECYFSPINGSYYCEIHACIGCGGWNGDRILCSTPERFPNYCYSCIRSMENLEDVMSVDFEQSSDIPNFVSVYVTNNGVCDYSNISIEFTFMDYEGDVLGRSTETISSLESGDTEEAFVHLPGYLPIIARVEYEVLSTN